MRWPFSLLTQSDVNTPALISNSLVGLKADPCAGSFTQNSYQFLAPLEIILLFNVDLIEAANALPLLIGYHRPTLRLIVALDLPNLAPS